MPAEEAPGVKAFPQRRIYVRRKGRLTRAQARALAERAGHYRFDGFDAGRPAMAEIGFGTGQALIAFAASHPRWTCIGLEVYKPGIGSLMLRCDEQGINNVRIVEDDARAVLEGWPLRCLRYLAIWFPDPWPKARHEKRRLIQPGFVKQAARVLEPGGRLALATDWQPYAAQMLQVADAEPALTNEAGPGCFSSRPDARPPTRFETRGEALGHDVRDLSYVKAG